MARLRRMSWTIFSGWFLVTLGLITLFGAWGALGVGLVLLAVGVIVEVRT